MGIFLWGSYQHWPEFWPDSGSAPDGDELPQLGRDLSKKADPVADPPLPEGLRALTHPVE